MLTEQERREAWIRFAAAAITGILMDVEFNDDSEAVAALSAGCADDMLTQLDHRDFRPEATKDATQ